MRVEGREIGAHHPPYVVAEMSGEHLGHLGNALQIIKQAKSAGADAVKAQCFHPLKLAEARGGKDKVLPDGLWAGRRLYDLYAETHTPREWFPTLFACAKNVGITLFSSVFDPDDVDFLVSIGCPALKIAAAEAEDRRLVMAAKATGLPLIISINDPRIGADNTWAYADAVLYCPPGYPCPLEKAAIRRIASLPFSGPIGFSDHTLGIAAATAAIHYGAKIIEKHITLSHTDGGPDKAYSLEPERFAELVRSVREAHTIRMAA